MGALLWTRVSTPLPVPHRLLLNAMTKPVVKRPKTVPARPAAPKTPRTYALPAAVKNALGTARPPWTVRAASPNLPRPSSVPEDRVRPLRGPALRRKSIRSPARRGGPFAAMEAAKKPRRRAIRWNARSARHSFVPTDSASAIWRTTVSWIMGAQRPRRRSAPAWAPVPCRSWTAPPTHVRPSRRALTLAPMGPVLQRVRAVSAAVTRMRCAVLTGRVYPHMMDAPPKTTRPTRAPEAHLCAAPTDCAWHPSSNVLCWTAQSVQQSRSRCCARMGRASQRPRNASW